MVKLLQAIQPKPLYVHTEWSDMISALAGVNGSKILGPMRCSVELSA